ncbi:DNA mismatch repair protein MutL [bioreactor metagenome]|uniref:DNA mismatch repair protein MutL n=1 Tax=bioreactor metagenome TaxID=1076179 RepID=A0A644V2G0_9ZZZZ|nr:DNA mismatch repair endonuclease MutL [Acidaminococcaceae bacterium]
MEAEVRVLDQNTANQIAAGEVVEKPASVVKELIENSLDAGANNIEVTIYEGGTEYIRVVDNGSGMSKANANLSVLRHATSKIRNAEDLQSIHSLGFRGEALPSIASVAKFELITRLHDEEFATAITINGGTDTECIATGGNVGTAITVRDLFFNVPARRKFLRTVNTEGRYINEIISKIALSRPDVHFRLLNNDKEVINTPGNGNLVDTIASIYGKNVANDLIALKYEDNGIGVSGYIGKPTMLKGTRQWQTIFVNGRTINNRMIGKALDHAYRSQIPKGGFPFAVLDITVDTANIDINVHPQKSEIKFGDEGAVYRVVYHALSDALTKPLLGSVDMGKSVTEHSDNTDNSAMYTKRPFSGDGNNYQANQQQIWKTPERIAENNGIEFSAAQRTDENMNLSHTDNNIAIKDVDNGVDNIWPLGQIDRVFIVAQSETALYLIDQHAAHERVMYDKLVNSHQNIPTQQFLIPLYLDATPQEVSSIEEYRKEFMQLGVDVEPSGETILRVSSLPADIKNDEAEEFIREILTLLSENKKINPADLREEVLHYAACHSAIRAGEVLNIRQMRALILELLNTEHPFTCPHGRPCMVEITSEELYKMFKRT